MTWVYYVIAAVIVIGVVFWLVSRKKGKETEMFSQDQDQNPSSPPPSVPPTPPTV